MKTIFNHDHDFYEKLMSYNHDFTENSLVCKRCPFQMLEQARLTDTISSVYQKFNSSIDMIDRNNANMYLSLARVFKYQPKTVSDSFSVPKIMNGEDYRRLFVKFVGQIYKDCFTSIVLPL